MTKKQGALGLIAICVVVLLLSAAGLASDFLTRLLMNIDGLLLLMICLLMGGLFLLMLFMIARDQGWIPAHSKKQEAGSSAPAHPVP